MTTASQALSFNELAPSDEHSLLEMLTGFSAGLHTAMPAIVVSFDATRRTVTAQPAIRARMLQKSEWTSVDMPMLQDVPVQFPAGGGWAMTFPLVKGDEVLIVCASRCIDSWWQSGGVQEQAAIRFHSLSDGFAIPCVWSLPRIPSPVFADGPCLINDDGSQYLRASGGKWFMKGDLEVDGDVKAGTISLKTHTHGNVQSGSSDTGAPNA